MSFLETSLLAAGAVIDSVIGSGIFLGRAAEDATVTEEQTYEDHRTDKTR